MKKYSEEELLNGIRSGSGGIILFMMKRYADNIEKMLKDLGIERVVEPDDIMQEGMVELILNVREDRFRGQSAVATYYFSICRFICLRYYNRHKTFDKWADVTTLPDEEDAVYKPDDRLDQVFGILGRMKKECIEIINLRFGLTAREGSFVQVAEKRALDEVAQILEIETANARQRFGRCIQTLLAEFRHTYNNN